MNSELIEANVMSLRFSFNPNWNLWDIWAFRAESLYVALNVCKRQFEVFDQFLLIENFVCQF